MSEHEDAVKVAKEWLSKNIVGYRQRIRACEDIGAMPPEQIGSLAALLTTYARAEVGRAREECIEALESLASQGNAGYFSDFGDGLAQGHKNALATLRARNRGVK